MTDEPRNEVEAYKRFMKVLREGDEGLMEVISDFRQPAMDVVKHLEHREFNQALAKAKELRDGLERLEDMISQRMTAYDDDPENQAS